MAPASVTSVTGIVLFDALVEPDAGDPRLSVTVTAMRDPCLRTRAMPPRFPDTKIGLRRAVGSLPLPIGRRPRAPLWAIRWFPRRTSAPNPKLARQCRESDRELRVQRGTRIIELPVAFDSEARLSVCGECGEL